MSNWAIHAATLRIAAGLTVSMAAAAHAQTLTWDGQVSNIWDHESGFPTFNTNWSPESVPNSSNAVVFQNASPFTIGVNGTEFARTMQFSGSGYTFNGGQLVVSDGIITNSTSATQTFNVTLNLSGPGQFNVNSGRIRLLDPVTSTGPVTKTGGGILELNAASNNFGLTINAGEVEFRNLSNLGAANSTVNLGTATLRFTGPTIGNRVLGLNVTGAGDLRASTGTIVWPGILSGAGPLRTNGPIQFTNLNSHSGGIEIQSGTVSFAEAGNLGAPGNDITLAGGSLVAVAGSTATFDPGRDIRFDPGPGGALELQAGSLLSTPGTISNAAGVSPIIEGPGALRLEGAQPLSPTEPYTLLSGASLVIAKDPGISISGAGSGDSVVLGSGTTVEIQSGVVPGTIAPTGPGAQLSVTGGAVDTIEARILDGTSISIEGGMVAGDINLGVPTGTTPAPSTFTPDLLTISGGTITGSVLANSGNIGVRVEGGAINGGILIEASSQLNVSGGTVGNALFLAPLAIGSINGGDIQGEIIIPNGASLTIVGSSFVRDGIDVTSSLPLNQPSVIIARDEIWDITLTDGSPLNLDTNANPVAFTTEGVQPGATLTFFRVAPSEAVAVADLTTTGATIPGQPGFGVPDGNVDLDDLGYYINFWLQGVP